MVQTYRNRLNEFKGQHKTVLKNLESKTKRKEELEQTLIEIEECRTIVQEVAKNAQNHLVEKLNSVVSTALGVVFGEDWEFKMIIKTQANSLQAFPTFYKNGVEESPKISEGGGLVSVASLALRIALLSLTKNPSPIVVLDEPLSNIGKGDIERTCKFLTTISESMNIQFLIVTHSDPIKKTANRLFHVTMDKDGRSHVEVEDVEKEIMPMEELDGTT